MGIGVDIIEIDRFRKRKVESYKSFYASIFTNSELKRCLKYSDPYTHFSGIFAAKEAIMKGTNRIRSFTDIEICKEKNGKPFVKIDKKQKRGLEISISHTKEIAVAISYAHET